MKKTLIVLAIAALPFTAMADVEVYGKIKAGVEFSKSKGVNNTITNANDWGSRIGFKGQEDLGNGIKAIWQIEQKVNVGGKSTGFSTRDSFIGLATDFGTIRAGYISNYFLSGMGDVNAWEGNSINVLGTFTRAEARHTGVRYDSPDFGGLTFAGQFAMEDNARAGTAAVGADTLPLTGVINDGTQNNQVFGLGVAYQNAGIFAKFGAEGIRAQRNVANKQRYGQAYRVEGGYDANNIFAVLAYQFTKYYADPVAVSGTGFKTTHEVALTGAYTIGNLTPRASIVYGTGTKSHKDHEYKQAVVGADYALSKRTTALVNFGWMKADKKSLWAGATGSPKGEGYHFGAGMVHKF